MCVMDGQPAMTNQMKMLRYVLSGIAPLATGSVKTGYNVYWIARFVMVILGVQATAAKMDLMRISPCVYSGTALLDAGNVWIECIV